MKLYAVNTGYFKLDGGAMFGVVPKTIWSKTTPADENNLCSWALRSLLIQDDDRLILIDNGTGNKQSEKFFSYYYMFGNDSLESSLAKYGFSKDDITDVILTHLHFDHCGGSIEKDASGNLVPAFKNATYWSNAIHWDWAIHPNDREKASFLKENILPIEASGQLKFIDVKDNDPNEFVLYPSGITKNISIYVANGHTKGLMVPIIQYNGKTIAYVADLIPSIPHIPIAYVCGYDSFPMISMQEKKAFLQAALQGNYTLFFEHDEKHECCNLQQTERGIREKDIFSLSEIKF